MLRAPLHRSGLTGGAPCDASSSRATRRPFEVTSKRRRGFPSETRVMRGTRVVHGDKELLERLGRNDPCPCGSGRRFPPLLPALRSLRRIRPGLFLSGNRALFPGDRHQIRINRVALPPPRDPGIQSGTTLGSGPLFFGRRAVYIYSMSFRCPHCNSSRYEPVSVKRPNGTIYRSDSLLACQGCSLVFTDPVRFSRPPPSPSSSDAIPSSTWESRRTAARRSHGEGG